MRGGWGLLLLLGAAAAAAPVTGGGTGTATASPRGPGEPCGVYTPGCARGLRCIPRPGERAPLRALLRGTGLCRPLRARPAATGPPAGDSPQEGAPPTPPPPADGKEELETAPCRGHLAAVLQELRAGLYRSAAAIFLPNCDTRGFYRPKQQPRGSRGDGAPPPPPPEDTMAQDERETLLALQQALSEEQFQTLKYLLGGQLPLGQLGPATRPQICSLLLQRFPGRALQLSADLLRRIGRHDLIRLYRLPGAEDEAPPGEKAPSGCGEAAAGRGGDPPPVASSPASGRARRLTEKELMQLAQKLGKEWQEVGIACLGLEKSRLDQIREDNPRSAVMQSFEMLLEWQRREQHEATAPRLCACLAPARLDPQILDVLQSFHGD
ncbi:uncharacterized protein LOC141938972 isoform X1 [Strix uralensis]|uniref:uncharacterized protein LOC141938972 isoform X1 n=1 Tax=Strix uralensis TaxID=36305 RepID=UPI003DA608DD